MGALRLYKPDPTRTVMLWNATGNHQNIWLQANVDVRSSTWFQVSTLSFVNFDLKKKNNKILFQQQNKTQILYWYKSKDAFISLT